MSDICQFGECDETASRTLTVPVRMAGLDATREVQLCDSHWTLLTARPFQRGELEVRDELIFRASRHDG